MSLIYLFISNFVFRMGKNYYPQVFLEECKDVVEEKKIAKSILLVI